MITTEKRIKEAMDYYSAIDDGKLVVFHYDYKDYIVSSNGHIYSLSLKIGEINKNNILNKHNGYATFSKTTKHRIIWEAFNGRIPKGYDIDHIDGNHLNNRLDNLQLLTHNENIKKRDMNGAPMSGRTGYSHPRSKSVVMLDLDDMPLRIFESGNLAGKYIDSKLNKRNSQCSICACLHKKCKTAYGYKWLFLHECKALYELEMKLLEEDDYDMINYFIIEKGE